VTLKGTPIQKPVEGTIKSLKKLNPQHLKTTLTKLNKEVYKRIYITGPDKIKELEQVIKNDCGWQERIQNKQKVKLSQKLKGTPLIYLVPVPSANQAQIRIGRYMTESEAQGRQEFKQFAGSFLGGGFTSQLMQELRLKRGLTYSASAYISSQGGYGRSGINTFTKNETLKETLDVIKEVLAQNSKKIDKEAFEHFKRYLKGNYLFGLESNSAFINQLINNDHLERSYAEIYQFPNVIESAKKEDIRKVIDDIFKWEEQVILVVGDKSLQSELEKIGKVQILKYQDYL
jgi:zinc protease